MKSKPKRLSLMELALATELLERGRRINLSALLSMSGAMASSGQVQGDSNDGVFRFNAMSVGMRRGREVY